MMSESSGSKFTFSDTFVKIWFDSSVKKHQFPEERSGGYGFVVVEGGTVIDEQADNLGQGKPVTNHRCQYDALISALKYCKNKYPNASIELFGRQGNYIEQIEGRIDTNDEELRWRRDEARELLDELEIEIQTFSDSEHAEKANRIAGEAAEM
ncbi:hypothetical protein [Haloarchaeobius sp. DYHT-AS-18]|uniref:hypothetical protein n=1 Tax=Haloarchaeobius sp. DYHT-AS-18 TaxID=3446117 RepID=UPI003EBCBABA